MDRITSMTAFTTVVTSGSFVGAARRLNMSPAMVTNHVHALEKRLGTRLLRRTTRSLSLTEAGECYFERCTRILAQVQAAENQVRESTRPTASTGASSISSRH
jgi:DNA-binding transcriptional LysR family regulator